MTLELALALDLATVAVCASLMAFRLPLRHSHPAVLYLVFHVVVFTLRGYGLLNGAAPYLSTSPDLLPIQPFEVARALNYADLFLICATFGWLTARRQEHRGAQVGAIASDRQVGVVAVRSDLLIAMAVVCIPVGVFALLRYAYVPGTTTGPVAVDTSYKIIAQGWPGLALCALIYRFGFRWFLTAPLLVYLFVIGVQGQSRFQLVLPTILLFQIYLDRRGSRWPSARIVAGALLLFILFFPLKEIGAAYQGGASISQVGDIAGQSTSDSLTGKDSGQVFLDEFAGTLTLVDQHGAKFWGRPYLNVVTLPVPRPWWPDKPSLADHIKEISTPARPFGENGAVTTLPGDLYLNFGFAGMLVGAVALARVSLRLYGAAYARGLGSVAHLAYLLLAAAMIQVLRDGLISLVTFVLVRNLPVLLMIGMHFVGSRHHRWGATTMPSARESR